MGPFATVMLSLTAMWCFIFGQFLVGSVLIGLALASLISSTGENL